MLFLFFPTCLVLMVSDRKNSKLLLKSEVAFWELNSGGEMFLYDEGVISLCNLSGFFQGQGIEPIDVLIEEKISAGIRDDINPYLKDPENCWSLWEADLWKMQKAFADYAALDCSAVCPEEKRKEIREGMQLFIDKYDALWY